MDNRYVRRLEDVDAGQVEAVGGKGAQLGELMRIEGVQVPAGFCVTTAAFARSVVEAGEPIVIPDDVATAITAQLGPGAHDGTAYAVRSSATAEDLPTASFAGQHDTYLNVVGADAILRSIARCWASLFTERAVSYRQERGVDQRAVRMAVVVQEMVFPHAAGVAFTADPVSGDRRLVAIEASLGLGEALVSGAVNPDRYTVRDGTIVSRALADPQAGAALTEEQVLRLAALARQIEAHFGAPQDIEWCLADDRMWIVQSRPITTLYPVPVAADREPHIYLSVGHQQMMTDAMRPLGLSVWQLTAFVQMHEAGGRLFVDVAPRLAVPAARAAVLEVLGRGDPLFRDALETLLERGDVLDTPVDPSAPAAAPRPPGGPPAVIETDAEIVTALIARSEESLATLKREIVTRSGAAVLDFIESDIAELKRIAFDPLSQQAIMAGMEAAWWLNDHLAEWLDEQNPADTLSQSAPFNVTSEMGLALLDVADAIRPHPEVVAFLENVEDDRFLDTVESLAGGAQARAAIEAYLQRYGMRCIGEIDITRPRWREQPSALVPLILSNVRNFTDGAATRHLERGLIEAAAKESELLERLRALPGGELKAEETKRQIERLRTFVGYREYPKYGIVSRHFVYKQALLREAEQLVADGVLDARDDVFYLTFQEVREALLTGAVEVGLIERRTAAFRINQALTPPRVLTSDGEMLHGAYRRAGLPSGALVGLGVSSGTVEGRARVILDVADADLLPGDILVTPFTDPCWSPLFVAIAGLVTEVGGLMTHGAVIAREYGLPGVVGVRDATRLIQDGQRIRVHGTDGYVEVLEGG